MSRPGNGPGAIPATAPQADSTILELSANRPSQVKLRSYRYSVRVFEQEVIFGAWGSQEGEPVAEESAEVWKSLHGHLSRSLACQGSWSPLQTRVLADLGAGGPGFKSRHPDQFMQVRALLILAEIIRAGAEGSHPPLRRASQLA